MITLSLNDLRSKIDREIAVHGHLEPIRAYNHAMLGELGKILPLPGKALLDLGASVHGFALDAALGKGVRLYEGIDFDIERHWSASSIEVTASSSRGRLRQMNAEHLAFECDFFDCLLSISTFEHFLHPEAVLAEMFRVLRPGGVALLSFEPIWTASYGHHLHHFGAVSDLVPPWSHLFLSEEQLRQTLNRAGWPANAPLSVDDAIEWTYRGEGINRLSLRQLRATFEGSAFAVEWICPIPDEKFAGDPIVPYVSRLTTYDPEELLTRGLSVLLRKSTSGRGES